LSVSAPAGQSGWLARVSANESGRDFAIWGIEGNIERLADLLSGAAFRRGHDRLFGLGNVVDGNVYHACSLLTGGLFEAILAGPNERSLLKQFAPGGQVSKSSLGFPEVSVPPGRFLESVELRLRELPVAVSIGEGRSTIGLVVNKVPYGLPWHEFESHLSERHPEIATACCFGDPVSDTHPNPVEGVSLVVCGGFRVTSPTPAGNVVLFPPSELLEISTIRARLRAAKSIVAREQGNVIRVAFGRTS